MLPEDIKQGTKIYYVFDDGSSVREFTFNGWLGKQMWYATTTTGHQPDRKKCFLTRKAAVEAAVKILRGKIDELEATV